MAKSQLILGIDVGTTSLKMAVFTERGEKVSSAIQEYRLLTPQLNMVETPCGVYMDSIQTCLTSMERSGDVHLHDITTIGFSVQSETLLFLDDSAQPLRNAIVWMDNRAGEQAKQMKSRFGDELCYQITGQVSFEACWPAAKVLWVREHEPQIYAKVRHILLLEDYLLYQLTGRFVSECSLLSSTEYWDIRTKDYWQEMLDFAGIQRSWLPEIIEPGQMVGTILPEAAERLGLNPSVQVCSGCMDQAAAAVGIGNIYQGTFSENIGASLAICVPTKNLTYDPNRQMPVHYFAIPDTYMMHTFTTGGMCLRWFRDNFCQREMNMQTATGLDAYHLMDLQAATVPPGSDGLLALPHLQGSMAPDVNLDAKGGFYGATLKHTKAHFIRSIMESLGYIICRNLESITDMGLDIQQIRTMGGGSKSDLWNQIKADITGCTLRTAGGSQDVACLGAAILAGVAAGIFESVESAVSSMVRLEKSYQPDFDNHHIYCMQYEKYKYLFSTLSPLFAMDSVKLS